MNARFFLSIALFGLALHSPAPACSLGPGYLMRSNFELVRDTTAIVLARAIRIDKDPEAHSRLAMEILHVLKGSVAEKTLSIEGNLHWLGASDPTDFGSCRPGAGTGGCIAFDYRLDSNFLLFLEKEEGRWDVRQSPFSRVNEEVADVDAAWVRAVKEFLRISTLQTVDEQKKALREMLTKDHGIAGLNADIERHFHQPHGTKPFDDLEAMYQAATDDNERSRVLWAFANGKHPQAGAWMRDVIRSGDLTTFIGPVSEYVAAVHDAVAAAALVERLSDLTLKDEARWAVLNAVAEAGDASIRSEVVALFKTVSDEETRPLARYFLRHPDSAATAGRRSSREIRHDVRPGRHGRSGYDLLGPEADERAD